MLDYILVAEPVFSCNMATTKRLKLLPVDNNIMDQDLEEILTIDEKDSIDDVMEKMKSLREFLQAKNYRSLLPFLEAYIMITRDVKKSSERGEFNNPEALEQLDKKFAELYFEPMRKYLVEGEKTSPWKNYFNYIEKNNSLPLMELLLGINSHINADLATAIDETGYSEKEDFFKVNEILEENLAPILKYLAFRHVDIASLGILGARPFAWKGLERITDWRSLTWENAHKENFSTQEIRIKTEANSERMFEIVHRKDFPGILRKPEQYLSSEVRINSA